MVKPTVETMPKAIVDLDEETLIRILHVDDENDFLRTAKQILETQGAFQVETALSVEEAIQKMKEKTFDVIVSDYVMPGKNGLDFLKELRDSGNNIPFIIFTGKGREEVAIKALNLGADHYINKIGKPETVYYELAHGICQSIERKKAEEALKQSEMRSRSLIQAIPDMLFCVNRDGTFLDVPVGDESGLALPRNGYVGKKISELFPSNLANKALEAARRALDNNAPEIIEYKMAIPLGNKDMRSFEARIVPCGKDEVLAIARDITEREKAEEELLIKNSAIESSFSGIGITDLNGKLIYVNDAALKMWGYKNRNEIIGRYLPEFWKGTRVFQTIGNLKKRGFDAGEDIGKRKDGSLFNVLFTANTIKDEKGKPVAWLGSFMDITERKKAEEALRESEEEYRDLVNYSNDIVAKADESGNWIFLNPAVKRILGYEPEEMIGKSAFDFMLPEDIVSTQRAHERVVKEGKMVWEYENRYVSKDGKIVTLAWNAIALRDEHGNIIGTQGVGRDITERKRAKEELTKAYARLEYLVAASPTIIYTSEFRGKWVNTFVSKNVKDVLGYEPREFLENPNFWIEHIHPEDRSSLHDDPSHLTKKGHHAHEYRFLHKDGTYRWMHNEVKIEQGSEGKPFRCIGYWIDIAQKKKTEERLLYQASLLQNVYDAIIATDIDFRIKSWNKAAEQIYGWKEDEVLGKTVADVTKGEYLHDKHEEVLKRFWKDGHWKGEVVQRHKDGRALIVQASVSLIKDSTGNPIGAVAVNRDITESKKVESTLMESEEKYRGIVELAPDGIITADTKGVVTSVNSTFLRLTGYSREEIVGKYFTKLGTIRARDIPKYLKLMSSALRGKMPSPFEYSYVRKDGTIGWGEAHAGLLRKSGKITGFQVILRETTKRKLAEKAIRESQEKFELLFMHNPEAACYSDPDNHILDVNPRFEELFGYSLDEIKGKHINDVVVPKEKMEEAKMLDKKAEKGYVYHDTLRKRKDGTLVPVSASVAPITAEGRLIGYVAVYKDISQLKKTEQALKETLEKLETMNEKLGVVGKLTRHDVRNKLSVVTNNVYLAKQTLTDDHEALDHLSQIESACDHVERIFDFARIYEMLGMEELTYMDVERSLEWAVSLFSNLHGVKVVNDCRGLTVLADSLLRQLFYNLIDNSLKHGAKVSRVRIYYEKTGKNQLKLVYEDDGAGIPKAEKEKIFTEGYGKDTGYGLYLIRKMCEVYSWNIRETGKQGKGAQFTITIPKMNQSGKIAYRLR